MRARRFGLVLAAASLTQGTGCFLDPAAPSGSSGDAGNGLDGSVTGTCSQYRALTESVVVRVSDGTALVEGGNWNNVASLVIHDPGPTFDIDCPAQVIPLADVGGESPLVLDIASLTSRSFLVLRVNDASNLLTVQRVSRDEPTVQPYFQIATSFATHDSSLAYAATADPSILITTGNKAWTASEADLGTTFTRMDGLVMDDEIVAAGPLPPGSDASWLLMGRRSIHTASGATGVAPVVVPVSTPSDSGVCVSQPVSSCPSRRGRSGLESTLYVTGSLTYDSRTLVMAGVDQTPQLFSLGESTFPGTVLDAVPAFLGTSDILVLTNTGAGAQMRDKNGIVLVESTDPASGNINRISAGDFLGNGKRQAIIHAQQGAVAGLSRCVEFTAPSVGTPCGS